MKKEQGNYCYSPSDLTQFMESPFASWMNRYVIECPENAPQRDACDPLSELLRPKGYAHEEEVEARFIQQGKSLVKVAGCNDKEKWQNTQIAMNNGVDVICQARLEQAPFAGFADFLVKQPGKSQLGDYHYEVWDAKLSSVVKPIYAVQLCCYTQMLEDIQGVLPKSIVIALGNGKIKILNVSDYYYYYLSLKKYFLEQQHCFSSEKMPDPVDSKNFGTWSNYAEKVFRESDHLIQVATITRSQIKKLNAAGIYTVKQLTDNDSTQVPGISTHSCLRLQSQAQIQYDSRNKSIPIFKVLVPNEGEKKGLALLPTHSNSDVFFDIEGFPLDDGGLEYLWGCAYFDCSGNRQYIDFWAHNQQQEKQSFKNFIEWVYQRWMTDPTMHIYHYANYEITACRKLMGRYGVCEKEVDQLLRNDVFIDLYKIVKGGILLGEPRYSIKNVEHLYRCNRYTEVGNGKDSVVVYEQWRELNARGEQGDTWQSSAILNNIRDYNIDDCHSTQELVEWLRDQQKQHDISYIGKSDVVDIEQTAEITERELLRNRLLIRAEQECDINKKQATLTENLAWFLDFHRRECKPIFWRLFDRLGQEPQELMDDLACLALCRRTMRKPYTIKRSVGFEYQFDANQEFKAASNSYYVLGESTEDDKPLKVNVEKKDSDFEQGLFVIKSSKGEPLPSLSLIPDEYVNPKPIPEALTEVAIAYEKNSLGQCAIVDFLHRSTPRIKGHSIGEPIANSVLPDEKLQQIITAICNLDNSYLPIQGPPGAGKSYTGKHVIARLMEKGMRVGICSNSHKAINNLLISTAKHCHEHNIPASFACTKNTGPELELEDVVITKNSALAASIQSACVVGTTAWGFARDDMLSQLDYLFIDEAGQVSVANLIAMSRSTNNLVLMGDQMQLAQPTQGVHPLESGASILDYLLHESPTIEPCSGVFLDTTYRMHSAVNRFISESIYEGKLHSAPENDRQIIAVPDDYHGLLTKEAGIVYIPVEHEGNTQGSDEEVAVIVDLAQQLHGRLFTDKDKQQHLITWQDMLFIAPYNHQVNKLQGALSKVANDEYIRVGSVDKFQGQEAPIVFLSMCASDASESPRGIDFLFDKNRLNVAISRAQSLAVVVANPSLAVTSANGLQQLSKINMFSQMHEFKVTS